MIGVLSVFHYCGLHRNALTEPPCKLRTKLGFAQFTGIHETTRNLDVLDRAGIPIPIKTTTFSVTAEDREMASNFLTEHQINKERPLIAIHPGSPIPLKRWIPERYAELADWLIARKRAKISVCR